MEFCSSLRCGCEGVAYWILLARIGSWRPDCGCPIKEAASGQCLCLAACTAGVCSFFCAFGSSSRGPIARLRAVATQSRMASTAVGKLLGPICEPLKLICGAADGLDWSASAKLLCRFECSHSLASVIVCLFVTHSEPRQAANAPQPFTDCRSPRVVWVRAATIFWSFWSKSPQLWCCQLFSSRLKVSRQFRLQPPTTNARSYRLGWSVSSLIPRQPWWLECRLVCRRFHRIQAIWNRTHRWFLLALFRAEPSAPDDCRRTCVALPQCHRKRVKHSNDLGRFSGDQARAGLWSASSSRPLLSQGIGF